MTESGLVIQRPVDRVVAAKNGKKLDFAELWTGASDERSGLGAQCWNGGFRGRPELADQLWPAIKIDALGWGYTSVKLCLGGLRAFFRFLDAYERRVIPVSGLADVTEALGWLWLHPMEGCWPPPTSDAYSSCKAILRNAHAELHGGRSDFEWPVCPRNEPTDSKDVPTREQGLVALTLLKHDAYAIYARWKRADTLAAQGRNLLDIPRDSRGRFNVEIDEADLHTTYRAVIARTGNPLPLPRDMRLAFGLMPSNKMPRWWIGVGQTISELQAGLYPTMEDIHCLSQLVMARSGWNPSTVSAFDISNPEWAIQHGSPEHDLWQIESWKERSKDWQQTICRGKTTTAPLHIVRTLMERTKPLRQILETDPSRATKSTAVDVAIRSPWLAAGQSSALGSVAVLCTSPCAPSVYWAKRITQHNQDAERRNVEVDRQNNEIAAENATLPSESQKVFLPHKVLIPESMTPSDWRDIYAAFVFIDSRYSWVLVQWALGHKHLTSTRHYLRSKLWRRYSENKLLDVQVAIMDEMQHGRLDLVVIRSRVEFNVNPTYADRSRLDVYRNAIHERELTLTGYKCRTPFHPPPEIDPGNPSDGTMACRRGERCPGCPVGLAVDAFHMVKRMVELEHICQAVSIVTWTESQFASDLDVLRADLRQWPDDEIARHRAYWEEEISSDRHMINRFGGKH